MAKARKLAVYKDGAGLYRWRATARNGKIVAASEQGYVRRAYARKKAEDAYPNLTAVDL